MVFLRNITGLAVIIILLGFSRTGLCIQCYSCQSPECSYCEHNFSNATSNCTNSNLCYKQTYRETAIDEVYVIRGCTSNASICNTTELTTCYTCNTTLCNGQDHVLSSIANIFAVLAVVNYFF